MRWGVFEIQYAIYFITHILYSKDQQTHFGFMNVILLYSDHGQVLATHVAGHLQHGKSKGINMFTICQDHSTV